MKKLEEILQRVRNFESEVNSLLSKYDASPARAIKLNKTISKLNSLSLEQEKLLLDAIECLMITDVDLLRPAHVIAWAAMADYLEQWLGADDFETVSKKKGALAEKKQKQQDSQNRRMTQEEKERRATETREKAEEYWRFQSVVDLRDTVTEHSVIIALRECGFVSKDEMKALEGLLSTRNQCAHPSEYNPNLDETLGFVSGILNRISRYEKKRAKI
ncbi:MAG: hypothetical protein ACFFER_07750 [Candidatus Thorarchaeota archaeon]